MALILATGGADRSTLALGDKFSFQGCLPESLILIQTMIFFSKPNHTLWQKALKASPTSRRATLWLQVGPISSACHVRNVDL